MEKIPEAKDCLDMKNMKIRKVYQESNPNSK